MTPAEMEAIVERSAKKAVLETLEMLGFDTSDKPALRADMAHLRRWRVAVEGMGLKAALTFVTILVTGIAGAIWATFQSAWHQGH